MAEQPPVLDTAVEPTTASSGRPRIIGTMAIVGFVLIVVLVECLVAYMVLPSAEDVAELAQAQLAREDGELPDVESEEEPPYQRDMNLTEVDLGEFGVTSYQPLSDTTLRIDFNLFGVVRREDESLLTRRLADNEHRFREQVLIILRSAEMTDLTDAGLGLIKRKILEKTNRILGKPLLQEVIFSEFSFVEQ